MGDEDKAKAGPVRKAAKPSAEPQRQGPTVQADQEYLREQKTKGRDRGGRATQVDVNPAEMQENDADWLDGRDPGDVVEVEGQRETAQARMGRNG